MTIVNKTSSWQSQLSELLKHNVPRFVQHIKTRGGVSPGEWRWLTLEQDSPDCLIYILERADKYLFFPENEEDFNQALFTLVKGLAILSFYPCGVRFMGVTFDASKT